MFQAEGGIRGAQESRGLGEVYEGQFVYSEYGHIELCSFVAWPTHTHNTHTCVCVVCIFLLFFLRGAGGVCVGGVWAFSYPHLTLPPKRTGVVWGLHCRSTSSMLSVCCDPYTS